MTRAASTETQPITQRYIFSFWLPLAASWALMALEGPFVQAAIARLPDPETHLAAFGIVVSLSVTIESPVIMLLATSTALCRDWGAFRVLRRFMLWLNLFVTVVAAIVAFTPVYNWVVPGLMGTPDHIAEVARPGLQVMTLWSAAIGWRRFYQGIMIRFGQTRRVSYGTAVRLLTSGGTAAVLAVWGTLPGTLVGSCALMAGVLSEAAFATWVVRPTLATRLSASAASPWRASRPHQRPLQLTMRRVAGFHLPLAATSLLTLLSQPLISAGLARLPFPEQSLAAWPVASSLFFVTRSFGMAVQEVTIALVAGPHTLDPVRRFNRGVALSTMLLLALVAFTPLADLYLREITGVSAELARFAVPGLRAALLLPGLTALQSELRALLMKGEATRSIYQAMGINLAITLVALFVGVVLQTPGVPMAAIVLTLAMAAEMIFLQWRAQPVVNRILAGDIAQ